MANTEWNGDSFLDKLRRAKLARLTRACYEVQNRVKEIISEPSNHGHSPSAPGEPPHKELGRLRASISHFVDEDKMIGYVGTNVIYGKFLELGTKRMSARPFLRPAVDQMHDRIKQIMTGKDSPSGESK